VGSVTLPAGIVGVLVLVLIILAIVFLIRRL
jgi:hypothetical protein